MYGRHYRAFRDSRRSDRPGGIAYLKFNQQVRVRVRDLYFISSRVVRQGSSTRYKCCDDYRFDHHDCPEKFLLILDRTYSQHDRFS